MLTTDNWPLPRADRAYGEASSTSPPPRVTAEEVFTAHAGRVYRLAQRMLTCDTDAEDVTQEVLLLVVRKLGSFRGDAELGTWLHRVTVNAVLGHRRKRSCRPEQQAPVPLDSFPGDNSGLAGSTAPDSRLLRREASHQIKRAIAGLPATYRAPFVLSDVEQLTNPEVADLLGLSVAAVKSRLHRARLMLRDALAPYFVEVAA